jgi:hypothetical protein
MSHPVRLSHRAVEHALRSLTVGQPGTLYGVPVERMPAGGYRVAGGHTLSLLPAHDALMTAAGYRPVDAAGWRTDDDDEDDVPSYGGRR